MANPSKDGFYLSSYIDINPLAHYYEIKRRHDQNVALWEKNGNIIKLVRFWELERFSREKQHMTSFFSLDDAKDFLSHLLQKHGLSINDMIDIWGVPGLSSSAPLRSSQFEGFALHSQYHLFSSLLLDSNRFYNGRIVALAVDGAPDVVTEPDAFQKRFYTGCYAESGRISVHEVASPASMWAYGKHRFGLREGSLMALMSACDCKVDIDAISEQLSIHKQHYVDAANVIYSNRYADSLYRLLDGIFQSGRVTEDPRFSSKENFASAFMQVVYRRSLEIMEANLDNIISIERFDPCETTLSISGGYALNCSTNMHLMKKYGFRDFISPPCVSDCGLSMGMGLYEFYYRNQHSRLDFQFENAYYGESDETLHEYVNAYPNIFKSVVPMNSAVIIKDIENGPVLWFNGKAEIGPRALGNRSIIADPRSLKIKSQLNIIKGREWWRPVAPIILESEVEEWFEESYSSSNMLLNYNSKERTKEKVEAVLHLDGTARAQTITQKDNADLFNILIEWFHLTGVPMLCNTSLNDKGEPIINKINELLTFAIKKSINILYINKYRVELFIEIKDHVKIGSFNPFIFNSRLSDAAKHELISILNPYGLTPDELRFYFHNSDLSSLDIKIEAEAKKVRRGYEYFSKQGVANILDKEF